MGERGQPSFMSRLGCVGRSRPCKWITTFCIRMVGSGVPASPTMSVIMARGTDGNALATSRRARYLMVCVGRLQVLW